MPTPAFGHLRLDFADESEPARWRGVAAVGEGVQVDFFVLFVGADFQQGIEMAEHRVDSGVAAQAEEVQGAPVVELFEHVFENGAFED